jgi:choline dehydrogenase
VASPEALPRQSLRWPHDLPKLREIIVAGGVFNSPQLLMLSGIGPKDHLDEVGIPVVVDLPGVGSNLTDRLECSIVAAYASDVPRLPCNSGWILTSSPVPPTPPPDDQCYEQWKTSGNGPYANIYAVANVRIRTDPEKKDCDILYAMGAGQDKGYFAGYALIGGADLRHWSWHLHVLDVHNHGGTVRLATRYPWDTPEINFHKHEFVPGRNTEEELAQDHKTLVAGVKFARKMLSIASDMIEGGLTEVWPGPSVVTDDDILAWAEQAAYGHHGMCTCKIGGDADPMAVLDSHLRVRGVTGLRVCDASVFPRLSWCNPTFPIVIVAEKCSDMLLMDIGEPSELESTLPTGDPPSRDGGVDGATEGSVPLPDGSLDAPPDHDGSDAAGDASGTIK